MRLESTVAAFVDCAARAQLGKLDGLIPLDIIPGSTAAVRFAGDVAGSESKRRPLFVVQEIVARPLPQVQDRTPQQRVLQ